MITFKDLEKVYNKLRIKILLLMSRGVLDSIDNSKKTQNLKIECLKDEVLDKIERLQEFGFESYPPVDGDTETLTLFLNGTRDIGLTIKCHNRELRPKDLEEGASCQYSKDSNDSNMNRVTIKPTANTIDIKTADEKNIILDETQIKISDVDGNEVLINSDGIKVTDLNSNIIEMNGSDINITGTNINLLGASEAFVKGTTFDTWLQNFITTIFNLHTHISAAPGAPTGPPVPVATAPVNYLSTTIKGA